MTDHEQQAIEKLARRMSIYDMGSETYWPDFLMASLASLKASGPCGQTIEANFKYEYSRELSAYRAMIEAAKDA